MPEGDSLHRAALKLRPVLVGKRIEAFDLPRRAGSTEGLLHRYVEDVEARGKNLLVHFDTGHSLHVHLKMHGRIRIVPLAGEPRLPLRDRVALLCTQQHAVVVLGAPIARLLERRDLVRDFHFRHLGPDLLSESCDLGEAQRRLRLRDASPLGEALMDQGALAGIGNEWKSELCFNLRLDPFATVAAFSDDELRALLEEAHRRMRDNVYRPRRTRPDPFAPPEHERRARPSPRPGEGPRSVYMRAGEACYDCGASVRMRRQGESQRSTYYCPCCQPSREAS